MQEMKVIEQERKCPLAKVRFQKFRAAVKKFGHSSRLNS